MYRLDRAMLRARAVSCVRFVVSSSVHMAAAILTLLLSVSCTPSLQPGPARLTSVSEETAGIRSQFGHADFNSYMGMTSSQRVSYRNNFIAARMYAIDVAYTAYEASLTTEAQTSGFITSTAVNAATGTATLITPVGTKNILTGAATFLNATSANFNDSVLFKQTTQLLQTQMRANRAAVAGLIIRRMRQDDSQYPLAFALSDVEEYYRAGTLAGAVIKANATVSAAEQVAQDDKEAAIVYSLSRDNASVLLRNSLVQNGKYNVAQAAELKCWLRAEGVTTPLEIVISNPKYSSEVTQLARDAGLVSNGSARHAGSSCR